MKKLMVAAAIVCAAVAANASCVSWGITSGSLDAEKFASGTLYLVHGSSAPSLTDLSVSAYTIDNILKYTGDSLAKLNTVDNNLELVKGAGKIVGTGNNVTSYDEGSTGAYKVYAVAVSADGQYAAVSDVKTMNINAASPAPAPANWAGGAFTVYTASAVPEPTSGLLLLLGVAGLVLKRRRA